MMPNHQTGSFVAAMLACASLARPAARLDQYGDPLPAGAVERLGTNRMRGRVADLAYSRDGGKALVIVGTRLQVWDLAEGKRVGEQVVSKHSLRTMPW